jgi:acetoin utilization deacetylase AcuC-like enzyme
VNHILVRIPVYSAPGYVADIGEHVMPMRKFDLVREAMLAAGLPVLVSAPSPATDADLLRVHTTEYVQAIDSGEPRALAESQKFPWSPALSRAVRLTNGGCITALEAALYSGVAANLASGFHHAHADHGEGFCTFNGLVVALEHSRAKGHIGRGLVIDCDLHYGNGTVSLLADRPHFFNLSVYGNWYARNTAHRDVDSERAADTDNCWSVPIPNGAGRDTYLEALRAALPRAIERSRPDAVLYQAGADPYREDPYSPLDLDADALMERDRLVFEAMHAAGIPVAWVLAGGYTRDVSKVVEVHVNTARAACEVFVR